MNRLHPKDHLPPHLKDKSIKNNYNKKIKEDRGQEVQIKNQKIIKIIKKTIKRNTSKIKIVIKTIKNVNILQIHQKEVLLVMIVVVRKKKNIITRKRIKNDLSIFFKKIIYFLLIFKFNFRLNLFTS